jgi:predicted dehydrogenase
MSRTACRIAVLGLDHWYSALPLIPLLARDPRVEIAGIADGDMSRAQSVAADVGVNRVVVDPAELIGDETIDAVAVWTSTDRNAGLCAAAVEAGKHVLSGKPIARTLDEATRVLAAVRSAQVHLLPGELVNRWGPAPHVRRLVRDGLLGDIVFARCSHSAGLPWSWPDNAAPGWFADPERCAGGAWIDHAIYQIDRLRWVLGREVASVSGQVATVRHEGFGVEDWGTALARFDGGVPAELRADWYMPTTAMFQNQWELAGTGGAIRADEVAQRVRFAAVPTDGAPFDAWQEVAVAPIDAMQSLAEHFVDVVTGEAQPLATAEDAWRNLAVATAFYEAAAAGRPVQVKEVPAP